MAKLEKETIVSQGGVIVQVLSWVVNRFRGRRIIECGDCSGTGTMGVPSTFAEWATRIVTCKRCKGAGEVWK